MRVLPAGSTALLVELDGLEQVLDLYAALCAEPPDGVVDMVPAARTILLVTAPGATELAAVERAVRAVRATVPRREERSDGELVEVPVTYDGADLDEVASLLDCSTKELVRRHTEESWTVGFGGFAPGFGYLVGASGGWDVPRRDTPRTTVPMGSVGVAGEFSGVYPRSSPGGWQLIGRTELAMFDPDRDPPALLRPGTRVRFLDVGRG